MGLEVAKVHIFFNKHLFNGKKTICGYFFSCRHGVFGTQNNEKMEYFWQFDELFVTLQKFLIVK